MKVVSFDSIIVDQFCGDLVEQFQPVNKLSILIVELVVLWNLQLY